MAKGYWIDRGVLRGPEGFSQPLSEHLSAIDDLETPLPSPVVPIDDEEVY